VPWIVGRALRGARRQCCAAIAGSVLIDLADGILARRIGDPHALRLQRRLDGATDAVFVVAAPLCAYRLQPALLYEERAAITLLGLCQIGSLVICYARFGRLPRYHTAAYKWSAGTLGVMLAGRVAGGWLSLGFRPAMVAVATAHLEALAISLLLETYRTPVHSLRTVLKERGAPVRQRQPAWDPQSHAYAAGA
jgi:CDP-diacylglycerol--glycerol-3-phosphate 3-phosphatidyltransferase